MIKQLRFFAQFTKSVQPIGLSNMDFPDVKILGVSLDCFNVVDQLVMNGGR